MDDNDGDRGWEDVVELESEYVANEVSEPVPVREG